MTAVDKLLIVPRCQYGYNTDYFQMTQRLSQKNIDIEMICFDQGHRKLEAPKNVNITYVERKESRAGNFIRYISAVMKTILTNRKDINWVIVSGTIEFCGILPFLLKAVSPKIRWILDIRTCSVSPDKRKRQATDFLTLLSSHFFHKTTIISGLVAERLKIKKYKVLPLGSDCYVDLDEKKLDGKKADFLYVGNFDERRVEDLVIAFDIVNEKLGNKIDMNFDIVGFSDREEPMKKVLHAIENSSYVDKITFHGRKSHDEIKTLFQNATIGFSYVPITGFFDVQPPTKTFEYIMNGIICIATDTKANAEIITGKNGVLIKDNVPSIVEGIEKVLNNIAGYNSKELSRTVSANKWANITGEFYTFLKRIDVKEKQRFIEKAVGKRAE